MDSISLDDVIRIDEEALPVSREKFPREDLVDPQFDFDFGVKATDILIILSTPRCGSTFLCEYLKGNQICTAHEYFQQPDYMGLMADRWGCIRDGKLNKQQYVKELLRFRVLENGWLGINLHGSHINNYMKCEQYFAGIKKHYLYLRRRDILAQAVSFELATQSKRWTSHFDARFDVSYDYWAIRDKVEQINNGNLTIKAFEQDRGLSLQTIYYEDLVGSPRKILATLDGICIDQVQKVCTGVTRQSTEINKKWISRFAREHLDHIDVASPTQKPFLARLLTRLGKKSR